MAEQDRYIQIVSEVALDEVYQLLESPEAGAVNVFIGTVRNNAQGKDVLKLEFEAYEKMAILEMQRIAEIAKQKWPIFKLVMHHAIGEKKVGEAVVIIGVSTAHRLASFEACQFLIDELKKSVPIWKKEFYNDNSVWVSAHP